MGKYRVLKTAEFDRDYSKLDKSEQKRVDKILGQLLERGGEVGKRLYYLVYSNVFVVLALAIRKPSKRR
ncbi:MAG: hypothetical protein QME59_07695 [Candidatus Hydrothermarchaeota archaeon]|nr:hypothetical protein [Candidatus Hydrothermarchaeota archaeon]